MTFLTLARLVSIVRPPLVVATDVSTLQFPQLLLWDGKWVDLALTPWCLWALYYDRDWFWFCRRSVNAFFNSTHCLPQCGGSRHGLLFHADKCRLCLAGSLASNTYLCPIWAYPKSRCCLGCWLVPDIYNFQECCRYTDLRSRSRRVLSFSLANPIGLLRICEVTLPWSDGPASALVTSLIRAACSVATYYRTSQPEVASMSGRL